MLTPRIGYAFFVLASLHLAGCGTYETYRIEPRKVTVKKPQATPQVTGTFALRRDPNGDGPTKLSSGGTRDGVTGGGCLVFRAVENPRACSTITDCESEAGDADKSSLTPYCLSEGLVGVSLPEKACWYKKGDPCVKSPVEALKLNKVVHLPTVDAFPLGNKPMLWRVITCQNLTDFGCASDNPQVGVNIRIRLGPMAKVE